MATDLLILKRGETTVLQVTQYAGAKGKEIQLNVKWGESHVTLEAREVFSLYEALEKFMLKT